MKRTTGLATLLDALEEDLLAAPPDELRDTQRETGRAWRTACEQMRSLLAAAAARDGDDAAAPIAPPGWPRTEKHWH